MLSSRLRTAVPLRVAARWWCTATAKQPLLITPRCAERILELSQRSREPRALRVSIEPGGCSGFQYKFTLEEAAVRAEDDLIFARDGAQIVVDESSLELLRGSTVDFEDDMMKSSFVSADVALSRLTTPGSTGTNRCLWPAQADF